MWLAHFIPDSRAGLHWLWPAPDLGGPLRLHEFAAALSRWRHHARDRQALAALDCRSLRDLGLAQAQVDYELAQPFWCALRDPRS